MKDYCFIKFDNACEAVFMIEFEAIATGKDYVPSPMILLSNTNTKTETRQPLV